VLPRPPLVEPPVVTSKPGTVPPPPQSSHPFEGGSTPLNVLTYVALIAVIAASAVMIWSIVLRGSNTPSGKPSVPLTGAKLIGSDSAPVVLLEFGDIECPACIRFAREILPALKSTYIDSGRLQVAFRHFPLTRHRQARRAANIAECAFKAGRFEAAYASLFSLTALDETNLVAAARAAGLSTQELETCGSSPDIERAILDDIQLGSQIQVTSTPTFIFGRRTESGGVEVAFRVNGVGKVEAFNRTIESLSR